jgi:hypothetical protein
MTRAAIASVAKLNISRPGMRYIRIIGLCCICSAHISWHTVHCPTSSTTLLQILCQHHQTLAAMLMHEVVSTLVLLAPCVQGTYISHVGRQADCEQFGAYPVYTGPCETTSMMVYSETTIGFLLIRVQTAVQEG